MESRGKEEREKKSGKAKDIEKIKENPMDDALGSSLGACQVSEVREEAPGV